MFNQNKHFSGIFFIKYNFIDLSNSKMILDNVFENYNFVKYKKLYNKFLQKLRSRIFLINLNFGFSLCLS